MAIVSWTLEKMRSWVRSQLGGEDKGFYTNADLDLWINFALQDFVARTRILNSSGTTSSVQSQKKYQLPGDFVQIEKVTYDGVVLEPADRQEIFWVAGQNLDEEGTPEYYYIRGTETSAQCLFLWRVPGAAGAEIELFFKALPDELVASTDTMLLAPAWARAVMYKAAEQGHRKNRQLQDARDYLGMYEQVLGDGDEARDTWHVDKPIVQHDEEIWSFSSPGARW